MLVSRQQIIKYTHHTHTHIHTHTHRHTHTNTHTHTNMYIYHRFIYSDTSVSVFSIKMVVDGCC